MRFLSAILGLACGVVATVALLLLDPVSFFAGAPKLEIDNPSALTIIGPAGRGIRQQPAALLGLGDPEGGGFSDAGLRHARFQIARLDSADSGAPALAVKMVAVARDNNLLRSDLFMDSAWNLVWPGHGSVFLTGRDDYRPLLADMAENLLRGDGLQLSGRQHPLTVNARLYGASGRLQGADGTWREYRSPGGPDELVLGLAED